MKFKKHKIKGNLDIIISNYEKEDADSGEILKWNDIQIHGDPKGLRSFAKLILEIADLDQEKIEDKYLPVGAREHYHLNPGIQLAKSSNQVILGWLDAKGTGEFYEIFEPRTKK